MKNLPNGSIAGLLLLVAVSGCAGSRQGSSNSRPQQSAPKVIDISIQSALEATQGYMGWPKYFDYRPTKAVPREDMVDVPEFASGKPWYDSTFLGTDQENPFSFAVDIPPDVESSRQAYIYFDANNDGAFQERERFGLKTTSPLDDSLVFETITAKVSIDEAVVDRNLIFAIYPQPPSVYRLQLFVSDYVAATLHVGGQSYPIRIIDQNKNGLFSDVASGMVGQGDHLLIDIEGDGFRGSLRPDGDLWFLGDYFYLNGQSLQLVAQHAGSAIRIQAEKVDTKPVRYPMPKFRLTLLDDTRRFTVRGTDGTAGIAPGKYNLLSYVAETTDEWANRWSIQWNGGENPLIVNTRKRTLEFGPPFRATIEAKFSAAGHIGLGVVLTGRAGETYSPDSVSKNGSIVTPYVRVIDEKGAVVAEGPSLVFGQDYIQHSFHWYLQGVPPGTYKAIPIVDYGPLDISVESLEFDLDEIRRDEVVPGEVLIPRL